MLKLLIFDLDGTLVDTGRDIADALNYALEPFGVKKYSVEETKKMVGTGISQLLKSLTPSGPVSLKNVSEVDSPGDISLKRFLEFYSVHLLNNTNAYPHVKETLAKLGDYNKAVLSNKRTAFSKEILDKLGLSCYFDTTWGSDSVREKKPSPAPILDLMKKFNTSAAETVIIGDSNFDIEAGKAAGIKVIAVTYGFRSLEFLKGADIIVDSFDELLKVIPKIYN